MVLATLSPAKYGKLLSRTMPKRIETGEEMDRFIEIMEPLSRVIEHGTACPEEIALHSLLATLIREYDERTYPLPQAPEAKPETKAAEYQQQGRQLIQEEHFVEAIGPLTEAVKLDPFLATTFNARGFAYMRLRRFKEAIVDFDHAIQLNPVYANAYTNRSAARRSRGDKAGAAADQAKARALLKTAAK